MAQRTQNYSWENTIIGPPQTWPTSLKNTLSMMLNSKFPMFIFWGQELIQFYNDAYRPVLGENGKHPKALGQKGEECWPEIWPDIYPIIQKVFSTGEGTHLENVLLPIYRNDALEDVYWTFSYSAIRNDEGKIEGVLVVCQDTTKTVLQINKLTEADKRFKNLIHESTVGMTVLLGEDLEVDVVNDFYAKLINRTSEELMHKKIFDIVPELEEEFRPLLKRVMYNDEPIYLYGHPYEIYQEGKTKKGYLDLVYKPFKDIEGKIVGIMAVCHDVTLQVESRLKIEESEHRIRSMVESAPFPVGVYTGREMKIEITNQAILDAWGKGRDVIGKTYAEVLPELADQKIFQQLDGVYTTGIPFHAKNQRVDLVVDHKLQPYYFNYSFTPLYDLSGKIYGVMNTAADVTDLNIAKIKLEESEHNLRNMILQAPVAICILRGSEFIIEIANNNMSQFWGRDTEKVTGKPLYEAVPEVKDQGYEDLMNEVLQTGNAYSANEMKVNLNRGIQTETLYINVSYQPIREPDNSISGIIAMAVDVTEQVMARKKIEEANDKTKLAIEIAQVGVYEIDLENDHIIADDRMNAIFGFEKNMTRLQYRSRIHPDDFEKATAAQTHGIKSGSIVSEFRLIMEDGTIKWVKNNGKILISSKEEPSKIMGVVQDITEEKNFAQTLEKLVNDRTSALEKVNEALLKSNQELSRSNVNLEEFAYAASHDLKEPIRKIHFFGDRIKTSLQNKMSEEDVRSFARMEIAAKRMSSLIDDLLSYSQVSLKPIISQDINLNEIINMVLSDLDLEIEEKNAEIFVVDLFETKGHQRQLQQAFQNLITNSLKYSKPGVAPVIHITASCIIGKEIVQMISPEEQHLYFNVISIRDNGIGFEQKDAERIFNVFIRLHGNTEFKGTGVGLSIVRKVIENHHGYITAESNPGEGAVFNIYLPVLT